MCGVVWCVCKDGRARVCACFQDRPQLQAAGCIRPVFVLQALSLCCCCPFSRTWYTYTQLPAVCCHGQQQTQDMCRQDTSDAGVCVGSVRGVCEGVAAACIHSPNHGVCVCAFVYSHPLAAQAVPAWLLCGWLRWCFAAAAEACVWVSGWLAGGVCAAGFVCKYLRVWWCGVVCVRASTPPMTAAASALPRGRLYTTLHTRGGLALSVYVCACSDLYQCAPQ